MDLETAIEYRNQKQVELEQAFKDLMTKYQVLLLALEKNGIKIGK